MYVVLTSLFLYILEFNYSIQVIRVDSSPFYPHILTLIMTESLVVVSNRLPFVLKRNEDGKLTRKFRYYSFKTTNFNWFS